MPSGSPEDPKGKVRNAFSMSSVDTWSGWNRRLPRGFLKVLRFCGGAGCLPWRALNVFWLSGAGLSYYYYYYYNYYYYCGDFYSAVNIICIEGKVSRPFLNPISTRTSVKQSISGPPIPSRPYEIKPDETQTYTSRSDRAGKIGHIKAEI